VRFASKGETGESNKERIIRIDTVQIDPLLPAQHKHRKLPPGPGSPPPPLHRSPSRKLTKEDM
jgi:SNW domain-containing protein 1